jgi:hypothetical protein
MSTHNNEKEIIKSKSGSDRDVNIDVAETIDERTAVPTPSHSNRPSHGVDSEKRQADIEKAIKEQQDGLPAPIEIPDGGTAAWLTVFGAYVYLF